MATIRKTLSATWKAAIRKRGWQTVTKTFRTKRDAEDWARRNEDEMMRGVYIDRAASERTLLKKALARYEAEVCPTKRPSTARREKPASANLKALLGDYSLAAITPDLVAGYRDHRLEEGLSASTVRLELARLSHLYTVAIKEWRIGLVYNPVATHPARRRACHLGRMLIALLLDHWSLLRRPLLYRSLYLKQNQAAYYRRLSAVRTEGDWIGWLRFFLDGIHESADDATLTARSLYAGVSEDRQTLLATPGATVTAIQLFEELPQHPVITMPLVTRLLSTTKPTAGKAIDVLIKAGILAAVGERKRDRLYRYDRYLRLLD